MGFQENQPLFLHADIRGFPGGSVVKKLPANARDVGLIPGSGRSPWVGNGNLLQYSCLGNPMDRGAWGATMHGVAKSWIRLSASTCRLYQGRASLPQPKALVAWYESWCSFCPSTKHISGFWHPESSQACGSCLLHPFLGHFYILTSNLSFVFPWRWNLWSWMLLFKNNILAVPRSMWDLSYPTKDQTPALEAWSLNHWTTMEVSGIVSMPGEPRSWQKHWRQRGHGSGRVFTACRVEPRICSITLVLPVLQSLWGGKMAAAKESFFHLCTVPPGLTKLFWTKLASVHCPGLSGHPLSAESLPLCTPRSRC